MVYQLLYTTHWVSSLIHTTNSNPIELENQYIKHPQYFLDADVLIFSTIITLHPQPKPFHPSVPTRTNPPLKHNQNPKYHINIQFLHNFTNSLNFLKSHPYILLETPTEHNQTLSERLEEVYVFHRKDNKQKTYRTTSLTVTKTSKVSHLITIDTPRRKWYWISATPRRQSTNTLRQSTHQKNQIHTLSLVDMDFASDPGTAPLATRFAKQASPQSMNTERMQPSSP